MRMKISDASWVNDEEPPPQFQEFSDDEEEQRAKKEIKLRKKSQVSGEATEAKSSRQTDTSNPRHCNQRYTPATNPFYRTSRTYHPGQPGGGGIQWSQYNVASQYGQPQPQRWLLPRHSLATTVQPVPTAGGQHQLSPSQQPAAAAVVSKFKSTSSSAPTSGNGLKFAFF